MTQGLSPDPEMMTWIKIKSWALNWLSHLGTPAYPHFREKNKQNKQTKVLRLSHLPKLTGPVVSGVFTQKLQTPKPVRFSSCWWFWEWDWGSGVRAMESASLSFSLNEHKQTLLKAHNWHADSMQQQMSESNIWENVKQCFSFFVLFWETVAFHLKLLLMLTHNGLFF